MVENARFRRRFFRKTRQTPFNTWVQMPFPRLFQRLAVCKGRRSGFSRLGNQYGCRPRVHYLGRTRRTRASKIAGTHGWHAIKDLGLYAMVSALGTGIECDSGFEQRTDQSICGYSQRSGSPPCRRHRRPVSRASQRNYFPPFVKLLNDPDPDVRQNVRGDLNEIESAMSAKGGIK